MYLNALVSLHVGLCI